MPLSSTQQFKEEIGRQELSCVKYNWFTHKIQHWMPKHKIIFLRKKTRTLTWYYIHIACIANNNQPLPIQHPRGGEYRSTAITAFTCAVLTPEQL